MKNYNYDDMRAYRGYGKPKKRLPYFIYQLLFGLIIGGVIGLVVFIKDYLAR